MNPLEIALIIIGIIVILISCILVDKSQKSSGQAAVRTFSFDDSLTQEEKEQLMSKLEELLKDVSEEVIVHTDDALGKISNEKIIAVNDFSDQILEKINRNHEEVVFLYNMLNDKEKELKSAVKEIDSSKKKVQDIMESRSKTDAMAQTAKEIRPSQNLRTTVPSTMIDKQEKPAQAPSQSQKTVLQGDVSTNNNSQILALYSQGKSVMEISKLLDLGQGEVKLVIDLFKGKR